MDWQPQPKQEQYLKLPWYEALFGGTKGPGKTDALLAESTRQLETPGYQGIIFRRTQPKLSEIVERSFKWFNKTGPAWNGEKLRWTWPNRNFIAFGYCKDEKDKYNYQGHEYGFMGFDQLEEFTETMYLFLLAQNRSSYPGIKCYTRSTANPGNIGHAWVKARFIDKLAKDGTPKWFRRIGDEDKESSADDSLALSRAFVFASVEDNAILLRNDPDYLKRLDMLPEIDKKALRYGDWDIFAGQFFKEWSRRIHVIPSMVDFGIANRRFIAFDYGYGAPASVGWYAAFPTGQIIRYKEFYKEGYTYEDLAYKILEINGSDPVEYAVADPAIWGDVAHHLQNAYKTKPLEAKGESGGEAMHRIFSDDNRPGPVHFPLMRADNSRIIGWGRVREYIRPYFTEDKIETAQFLITENCLNAIRTIPGLIHDSIIPEDLDTAGEDHPADEIRYALMSRPRLPIIAPPPKTPAQDFWDRIKADQARAAGQQEGEKKAISETEGTTAI